MYRKIDTTGRICIPSEMREKINLDINSEVKIELVGDKIVVTNSKKEDNLSLLKNKAKLFLEEPENKDLLIKEILETIEAL